MFLRRANTFVLQGEKRPRTWKIKLLGRPGSTFLCLRNNLTKLALNFGGRSVSASYTNEKLLDSNGNATGYTEDYEKGNMPTRFTMYSDRAVNYEYDILKGKSKMIFYRNGFIIKSDTGFDYPNKLKNYSGIAKGLTWPLEELTDESSIDLTNEAEKKWFNYQDKRMFVVPELEYLKRYEQHCKKLKISTICLQIESPSAIITTQIKPMVEKALGFDYVDSDMNTSCLYEDLTMEVEAVRVSFKDVVCNLNENGLIDSIEDMYKYLYIRNELVKKGYDMEEYYCPRIVKLSRVVINENNSSW